MRSPADIALTTDLYELTMGASYAALGMNERAVFSLFVRRLPPNRSFLVVAGVEEAVERLVSFRFDEAALAYLRATGQVREDFLPMLADLRFTGDVWAVPEGRVVFAEEPILEVEAPLIEAQLVETLLINAIHFPTLVATKAARCVAAAPGKTLIDFGLRRTPSIDAGLAVARASYIVGFAATSNLLAGRTYGIPVAGTVAHSFIQAFPSEIEAFRAFGETFPGGVTLLIDTYDTLQGARHAVAVARELAEHGKRVVAVRIDSGDLATLSRTVRAILDNAGLREVRIIASGGIDEYELAALTRAGAPIDAYGVGTRLGMSADAPVLDMAYKLVEYKGTPRLKLSTGKQTLVGPKQVWRRRGPNGRFAEDVIATRDEPPPGEGWEPLLEPVLQAGQVRHRPSLAEIRARHREEIAALPPHLLSLEGQPTYPVRLSQRLQERQRRAIAETQQREGTAEAPR
ncbi:MAG: nicotinate phosphoribosyltransferase [Chloroflexota bacterium]